MISKISAKSRHFTELVHHDTKIGRARAIRYGSYDEDTASLILAMIGVALMLATLASMLFAFKVL